MVNQKNSNYYKLIFTFIVFVAALFLSGFFTGKAFAATTYGEIDTFKTSELKYGIYYIDNQGSEGAWDYHYISVCSVPLSCAWGQNSANKFGVNIVYTGTQFTCKTYKLTLYNGEPQGTWTQEGSTLTASQTYGIAQNMTSMEKANYNVPTYVFQNGESSNGKDVFFSPLEGLAKIVQPLHLNQALAQVLSLLPILILVVVGFLGLRKGLALLQQILRQA